jgi:hypothetical protein
LCPHTRFEFVDVQGFDKIVVRAAVEPFTRLDTASLARRMIIGVLLPFRAGAATALSRRQREVEDQRVFLGGQ